MTPMQLCPGCDTEAELVTVKLRYRRGGRELGVDVQMWECAKDCRDPDGGGRLRFADVELVGKNDEVAGRAWVDAFGDAIPRDR